MLNYNKIHAFSYSLDTKAISKTYTEVLAIFYNITHHQFQFHNFFSRAMRLVTHLVKVPIECESFNQVFCASTLTFQSQGLLSSEYSILQPCKVKSLFSQVKSAQGVLRSK